MTEKAEAIRCRRFESVVNERYDFFGKYKLKADFLEHYCKQLRKHDQKWEFVYLHFNNPSIYFNVSKSITQEKAIY